MEQNTNDLQQKRAQRQARKKELKRKRMIRLLAILGGLYLLW